jgi:hypothetical protein
MVGVVEVAPADGAFLHLGGSRGPHKRTKADGSAQQSDPHGGSPRWFAIFWMSR